MENYQSLSPHHPNTRQPSASHVVLRGSPRHAGIGTWTKEWRATMTSLCCKSRNALASLEAIALWWNLEKNMLPRGYHNGVTLELPRLIWVCSVLRLGCIKCSCKILSLVPLDKWPVLNDTCWTAKSIRQWFPSLDFSVALRIFHCWNLSRPQEIKHGCIALEHCPGFP